MSTCLKDSTLLLLLADEGTNAPRIHLETCDACAARYRRVSRDLRAIEQVLWETSPPPTTSPHFSVSRVGWLPAAAVLTAVLVLIWGGIWLRQPAELSVATGPATEEVVNFLADEVSPALFATTDVQVVLPTPVSNEVYVQAALEGDWPCEQLDTSSQVACDFYPVPFVD